MKVFISSAVRGLEEYRDAAARGARALGHDVLRSEDFGAGPASPQQACLAAVRSADVVLLLLGARYGSPQQSGLSATHEEYQEARRSCQILVFVEQGVTREPAQEAFLKAVGTWTSGHHSAEFRSPEDLRDAVTGALHRLEIDRHAGPIDEGEMLARAEALVTADRSFTPATITTVVTCAPRQQILRPSQLEARPLAEAVLRQALFAEPRVLSSESGTTNSVRGDALIVEQSGASIMLDSLGTVRVIQRLSKSRRAGMVDLDVVLEEDVRDRIAESLTFTGWLLDHVDPVRSLSWILPLAALHGGMGWKTRAEHESSPGHVVIGFSMTDRVSAHLSRQPRATLTQTPQVLAEDLVVLIRRRKKP
jgi:Domain of unknown function (DUF4062)